MSMLTVEIPDAVRAALDAAARREHKSAEQVASESLARAVQAQEQLDYLADRARRGRREDFDALFSPKPLTCRRFQTTTLLVLNEIAAHGFSGAATKSKSLWHSNSTNHYEAQRRRRGIFVENPNQTNPKLRSEIIGIWAEPVVS